MKQKNVLFLCTGNSCRSQMAEGWARYLYPESNIQFFSAGLKKHGLNPWAVKAMSEVGVDISSQQSKTPDELGIARFDYVFTVCGHANETCPLFPGGKIIHVPFDDPPTLTKGEVDENEILKVYRRVRDEIQEFIKSLPLYMEPSL